MTRVALGIPHTPWIPERVESMARLRAQLAEGLPAGMTLQHREFTEREPNAAWSERMWMWMLETESEWCLTLQDDVELAPCFWGALDAMMTTLDGIGASVLGLSSVHPVQVNTAQLGHRWYRTRSHLVGWAYALRREALGAFLGWRAENPKLVATMNEDQLLNTWVHKSGETSWHPVPTICDHRTELESSYSNDAHSHRRPWITWRDFTKCSLCDPGFWRLQGPPVTVPVLPAPSVNMCWACNTHVAIVSAGPLKMCAHCVGQAAQLLITRGGAA